MERYYFSYNQIHQTVKAAAELINQSGFKPDYLLAIGAGGFIPARILRTYLNIPIITVSIAYYQDKQIMSLPQKLQWLDCVNVSGKKLLIVDEVDDTRATLIYCVQEILTHNPQELGVFVLHNKDKSKAQAYPAEVKHIFVGEQLANKWIHYPWDAQEIEEHDKQTHK